MLTYGVFNIETKDFFKFKNYEDAYKGYLMILSSEINNSYETLKNWYLVYINDNKVVQFDQFIWDHHCIPGIDINELDSFIKPKNW